MSRLFIERVMGFGGTNPDWGGQDDKIPVHDISALIWRMKLNGITPQEVKAFFQMDLGCAAEFDAYVATMIGGELSLVRALVNFEKVFILAETRFPAMDTPTKVRNAMGIPIPLVPSE